MSAVNLANIPAELKGPRTWCVWRLEPPDREGGKWKKMPRTVTGGHGDSTNPARWETGAKAYEAFEQSQAGPETKKFSGIGFVFYRNGPRYTGMDFDGEQWTAATVQAAVGPMWAGYVER